MGCNIPQVTFDFSCVLEFIQGVRNNDPLVVSLRRAATILLGVTQQFQPTEENGTVIIMSDFETMAQELEQVQILDAEEQSIPWELIFQLIMWWLQNRKG